MAKKELNLLGKNMNPSALIESERIQANQAKDSLDRFAQLCGITNNIHNGKDLSIKDEICFYISQINETAYNFKTFWRQYFNKLPLLTNIALYQPHLCRVSLRLALLTLSNEKKEALCHLNI